MNRSLYAFLLQRTPPCRQVVRLVSEGMDRRLRPWEALPLYLHFLLCLACARYQQQLRLLRKAAHAYSRRPRVPGLSPEARERLQRLLRSR